MPKFNRATESEDTRDPNKKIADDARGILARLANTPGATVDDIGTEKLRLRGGDDRNAIVAEVRKQAGQIAKFTVVEESTESDVIEDVVAISDETIKEGNPEAVVAEASEALAEDPLAKFKAQYESLPKDNILIKGSTWETVQARLTDPDNAEKMKKVTEELQGGGRLYAVMEDGSCEFMDDNSETPPMFVKDNETDELQIIYKRDRRQMDKARVQINAETHQWASIQEMLEWAEKNGFGVFEADTEDDRRFGKEMKLAEAASPDKLFVGEKDGPWMATALKGARHADFSPYYGDVIVNAPSPGGRSDNLGLLRRLRV